MLNKITKVDIMEKNRYSNLNGFFDGEERIASSFEFNDEEISWINEVLD